MPFPFDNSYVNLPDGFFQKVDPTPVSAPEWIALNREFAAELGIDVDKLDSPEGLAFLAGNAKPEGSDPLSMAYSGHQFGGFSPLLGDGRAILLGEVIGKEDETRRDIQLKGSGPTPFSRRGDGRSALGPVLREYLVSEAMVALGAPTTRALAAIWTGDKVLRDRGYEPGGVFTRVAKSHIRVGTFQWSAARQDHENLRVLADYVIGRHYPDSRDSENPYRTLLENVIQRQAQLIAKWMHLGFIHGVMNTDNMAISGETIDYGPCAFMDDYDPAKKFSFIDQQGRYAYSNQPTMAHWNLTRLAEAMLPLLADSDDKAVTEAESALEKFPDIFQTALVSGFTKKIGIENGDEDDWKIVQSLLALMHDSNADFTLTFRHLRNAAQDSSETDDRPVIDLFQSPEPISKWLAEWRSHLQKAGISAEAATAQMLSVNPVFIPRNHRIEAAIQAGMKQDYEPFNQLHQILKKPFEEQPEFSEFEAAPEASEVVCETFCGT